MIKYFYILVLIGILFLISTYIFIPDQIIVSEAEQVESSERILEKYLNRPKERRAWWPDTTVKNRSLHNDTNFTYEGLNFSFKSPGIYSQPVLISNGKFNNHSLINWKQSSNNIYLIGWKTSIKASKNPVKRIIQYQHARKIKRSMVNILENLLAFVVDSKNVYGINVEREMLTDTILATSNILSSTYPQTTDIYKKIDQIDNYIKKQGAVQVNAPMLNISRDPAGKYLAIIALPINKDIVPNGEISLQKMIVGNILMAEIKGGPEAVQTGFSEMKTYMKDFKLISPAMPFELLVTNRITEPDTSKWVTNIYYPIL